MTYKQARVNNGQTLIAACTNGPRDYYIWNVTNQHREETFTTKREMLAEFDASVAQDTTPRQREA